MFKTTVLELNIEGHVLKTTRSTNAGWSFVLETEMLGEQLVLTSGENKFAILRKLFAKIEELMSLVDKHENDEKLNEQLAGGR